MGIRPITATRAVFLDRDGVLNRNVLNPATGRYESPLSPEQVEVSDGVIEALTKLQAAGYLLVLVSNQPNYSKGKCSLAMLQAIRARLEAILVSAGIQLAAAYYCLHHPQGVIPEYAIQCACRKPLPYFLFKAKDSFGISLYESWMIGDRATDVQCGAAAGTRTIRVAPDHPCPDPDTGTMKASFEASDLMQAAEIILRNSIHRAITSVRPHQGNREALGIESAQ